MEDHLCEWEAFFCDTFVPHEHVEDMCPHREPRVAVFHCCRICGATSHAHLGRFVLTHPEKPLGL